MIITKALPEEYQEVRSFYHSVIDSFQDAPYRPMWEKDIYPSPEELWTAITEGSLFIGRLNDDCHESCIAGAMVVNQQCNESYQEAAWSTELGQMDFMVIHMLGVHSDFCRTWLCGRTGEICDQVCQKSRYEGDSFGCPERKPSSESVI